jgi:ADP-heptose:LPS heptosyltransferase
VIRNPVDPAAVRRVLFVRPRYLGDICLTLPAVDAARAACPQARFGYVVEEASAPLIAGDPRFDEVFVTQFGASLVETATLVRRIRAFAPDVVFDCFCNPRTAVWTALSGARVRVGYPDKGWRSGVYTHHVRPRTLSAVGFHLTSIARLGWPAADRTPRLHVAPAARTEAERELTHLGAPRGAELVGFHPGARWPTRRWHAERFRELIRRYLEGRPDGVALVTGAGSERDLIEEIRRGLPPERVLAVAGWPLDRFVALQSRCAAFVSGDTGPLHTAVAAGAPTLALMSRNSPAMFFPYDPAGGHVAYYARAECSPCHRDECEDLRCLKRLTVDGVWTRLAAMLVRAGSPALRTS